MENLWKGTVSAQFRAIRQGTTQILTIPIANVAIAF